MSSSLCDYLPGSCSISFWIISFELGVGASAVAHDLQHQFDLFLIQLSFQVPNVSLCF
jgi:hypothetical protein